MNRFISIAAVGIAAVAVIGTTVAFTQNSKDTAKPGSAPAQAEPPAMSPEEIAAFTAAGTPGPMQQRLVDGAGVWTGKSTSWMMPGAPPSTSDCTVTITPIMDGRFTKCDMAGEMPGMGPIGGLGLYGYDNVAKKFQATWLDSMGTGMMVGTGTLSEDGNTMTWSYNFTCPMTKKLTVMREVERRTGTDTKTLEMWAPYYKTGKDFKMMEITLTRKSAAPAAPATKAAR